MLTPELLRKLEEKARQDGRVLVPDCLIANNEGKIYVQKRSPDRRMFPNVWEIPGGHVDEGESIEDAIKREMKEELNLDVTELVEFVGVEDYDIPPESQKAGDNPRKRSLQFIVKASGDIQTEAGKVTEYKWIGLDDLDILREGRLPEDMYTYRVVKAALESTK
jgi:8-oxo-dGTP diphosphatase